MGRTARRFSQGSSLVASYIHDLVDKDEDRDHLRDIPYLKTLSQHSLVVPLRGRPLQDSVEEDPFLTDRRMRRSLEEATLINWCPAFKRLVPLAVTNDGNSLCHSASMAMWGVHDRKLHLRRMLCQALKSSAQQELKQRWRKQLLLANKSEQGTRNDFDEKWQVLLELSSEENKSARPDNPMYEPMDEFHIFILANILRRPILVFADQPVCSLDTEDVVSSFAGIYLPLLWSGDQCCKSPLLLGYCDNYYCPLITFGSIMGDTCTAEPCPSVVPLVGMDKVPIEYRYLTPEEKAQKEKLLGEYLLISEMEVTVSQQISYMLTVAKLIPNPMDETQKLIVEFFNVKETQETKNSETETRASHTAVPTRKVSKFKCGNKFCSEYIDQDHLFPYCSDCHPKFSSNNKKEMPTRRKINRTTVQPTSLEVECVNAECPYFAAVSCFPYCQRCYKLQSSHNTAEVSLQTESNISSDELSLEDRWKKLAMGEPVTAGTIKTANSVEDEILFTNLHRQMVPEDGEKCGMGEATSTRSHAPEQSKNVTSATGARSQHQRKVSKEELSLATNAINVDSDDWKRKISWINEPCIRAGCSYFASTRTYPYCNQCAVEFSSGGAMQRSPLSTLIQED